VWKENAGGVDSNRERQCSGEKENKHCVCREKMIENGGDLSKEKQEMRGRCLAKVEGKKQERKQIRGGGKKDRSFYG